MLPNTQNKNLLCRFLFAFGVTGKQEKLFENFIETLISKTHLGVTLQYILPCVLLV